VAGDAAFPRVEGYTITRVIGTGGFSTVYEATQDDIGSTVALKVLNVSIHDEAGARRLDREYRSMGRLRDQPGIVPVYGTARTSEGNAVIVMAFMPGGSLHDRIRVQGPLPAADVIRIADELATALAAAHEIGIQHRDIKPENVLFDARGNAALSDFGLASIEGTSDASTTAASLSPPHAPPERFLGDGPVDPVAGDVYSLSSTLATCITGRPPFGTSKDGGIAALILRITADVPPAVDAPGIPAALATAIAAGLAKEPNDRGRLKSFLQVDPTPDSEPTVRALADVAASQQAATVVVESGGDATRAFALGDATAVETGAAARVLTRSRRARIPAAAVAGLLVLGALLIGAGAFKGHPSTSGTAPSRTTAPAGRTVLATKLLNEGLRAQVEGDYKSAQAKFEDLLKVDTNNKFANYNLGYIAQTANNDNATASKYYAAAIKADPRYGGALYNLAIIETANGNKATAIDLYKRAITADPTDANANLNLGFLLYETGDKAGAAAAFRKAIALNSALRQRIPASQQPNG